jgi:hypothetical protein
MESTLWKDSVHSQVFYKTKRYQMLSKHGRLDTLIVEVGGRKK